MTLQKDLLNRQKFVEQLMTIVDTLSENKKNACFAINGDWGVGKSFVLDLFEEQVSQTLDENDKPKYLVLRYNCWEHDFYEEPLVALVVTFLKEMQEKGDVFPKEDKNRLFSIAKVCLKTFGDVIAKQIKSQIGADIKKAGEAVKEALESSEGNSVDAFDDYCNFKKELNSLQEVISKLAKKKTIVFIVDEIDRCLPEYAIKVLERLHHLFYGIDNVQVILSLDKKQLEYTIKTIYGNDADTKKYLAKFIQFELILDEGEMTDEEELEERFQAYTEEYFKDNPNLRRIAMRFFTQLLKGVDMRSGIAIVEKCHLLHKLANTDGKICPFSFFYVELFLTFAEHIGLDPERAADYRNPIVMKDSNKAMPQGLQEMVDAITDTEYPCIFLHPQETDIVLIQNRSVIGGIEEILYAYRYACGVERDAPPNRRDYNDEFREYTRKYWDLLQIIN